MGATEQVSGWFVMLLGMGTVFVGLVALIFITKLMSMFGRALAKRAENKTQLLAPTIPAVQAAAQVAPAAPAMIANRPQFVAAVASAIATTIGTDVNGLRIHSIRPVGGAGANDARGQFVAAVSAAIATEMGTDVNGLRIHAIKRV